MGKLISLVILTFFLTAFEYPKIPDHKYTPGHLCSILDYDFDRLRYDEQIPYCERKVSWAKKQVVYDAYGVPEEDRKNYTIDHFIPLSLGGSNHISNLWPEHREVKATRYWLEWDTYLAIEHGEITQREAIEIIVRAKTGQSWPYP